MLQPPNRVQMLCALRADGLDPGHVGWRDGGVTEVASGDMR